MRGLQFTLAHPENALRKGLTFGELTSLRRRPFQGTQEGVSVSSEQYTSRRITLPASHTRTLFEVL